jgi:hypothetical protein
VDRWELRRVSTTQIESVGFFTSERARAATAEDGDLIAARVDGAIAVDPFRN